jgi:hypothetical protein
LPARPTGAIAVTIPPQSDSAFVFRREFLGAIRKAISEAQVAGTIDTDIAVACFKALPIADPTTP